MARAKPCHNMCVQLITDLNLDKKQHRLLFKTIFLIIYLKLALEFFLNYKRQYRYKT